MEIFIPEAVTFKLLSLRKKYFYKNTGTLEHFLLIYKKYLRVSRESLLDSLIASANLTYHILDDDLDPLAIKAIEITNPNFDSSKLDEYSDEQLTGMINSAKGKYFELLVVDKLNSGEQVGDLSLPQGFTAQLAEKINQPGWDITINDPSGGVVDYLQLKATDNFAYISETLSRYPDIRILTTEEITDSMMDDNYMIIGSDLSDTDITTTVEDTFNESDPGIIDNFFDSFHPLVPLSVILAVEGYKIVAKKQSIEKGMVNSSERFGRSIFASGVGALVYALGGGILSSPIALMAGLYYRRIQNLRGVSEQMDGYIHNISSILEFQKMKRKYQNGIL